MLANAFLELILLVFYLLIQQVNMLPSDKLRWEYCDTEKLSECLI